MAKQERQTPTKNYIKTAVKQLLLSEGFEGLSVAKICQLSGINRSTFYRHYEDKFQMIEAFKQEGREQIFELIGDKPDFGPTCIEKILHYLLSEEDFYKALLLTPQVNLPQLIRTCTKEIYQHNPKGQAWIKEKYPLPYDYALTAHAAAAEALISDWLLEKDRLPPKEMAELISLL